MNRSLLHASAAALFALAACSRSESGSGARASFATPGADRALFTNGDFESNTIGSVPSAWTVQNYLNASGVSGTSSAPPSSFSSLNLSGLGTAVNETFVVGGTTMAQVDPDLGSGQSFRFPAYGVRAARVNYKDASTYGKNQNANVMRQSMTVGSADVDPNDGQIHVRFAVAPVLENPSHSYNQQPYFYIELLNTTRGTTLYSAFNVAGQAGVPWHTTTSLATGNAVQWLDWQLIDIAPGSTALTAGDTVQLTIVGSGCALGGHFGRIYVDGVGAFIPGPFVSATAPTSVLAGSQLTYTLRYSNGGTASATGTHVDFTTPPNTTFASTSGLSGCTTPAASAAGTVSCPVGTLAAGSSGTFTITVNVSSGATGSIVAGNYSIGAIGAPTLLGSKVTTQVLASSSKTADVSVTMTSSSNAVTAGTAYTNLYTILITNNSTTQNVGSAYGATFNFSDVLPAQLTAISWTCVANSYGTGGSNGTNCRDKGGNGNTSGSTSSISLNPRLGTGGGQIKITVSATIASSASGSMTNTATAGSISGFTDPILSNNTASITTSIGAVRTLSLTKNGGATTGSVTSTPSGVSCDNVSCTSTTANFGDGTVVTLVANPSPGGATFAGWSGTGVPSSCTTSPAPTTCTVTMSAALAITATFTPAPAVAAAAAIYVYSGDKQLARTGVAFGSSLQAIVVDANGTPVPNTTVTWISPGTGASTATTGSTSPTSSAGIASLPVIANSTAGTYSVTASVNGVATPATFTLTNVGPPASITYVNGGSQTDPQATPVTTQFPAPLLALVKDSAGNAVPGATVTFSPVAASNGASGTVASSTATTDSSGYAQVNATANTVVGSFNATATVTGVATGITYYLQNVASSPAAIYVVSGSPQTAPLSSAFSSALVAVVSDAVGNSLPNVAVSWAAPASGASSTLSASSVTTNSSGLASITATANAIGGPYAVNASTSGVANPAVFKLTNDGGSTLQVNSGSPQTQTVSVQFGAQLQALLLDANGLVVANAVVTFVAPSSGAAATLSGGSACTPAASNCQTAVTNASGIATVTATANATSGEYYVNASTPNAPVSINFDLTNQCTADTQCGGTTPLCSSTTHQCVACTTNAQCSTSNATKPYCDTSGACFACTADSQCSGATPICSQSTNSCAACTTDAQCANKSAATPYCGGSSGCIAGYTLTPSAGANGSISPAGAQTVAPGGSLSFTMTPATGYHVADVQVDGGSVGAVTTYGFTNVQASHTIAVTFAINTYTLTPSAGTGGTITPSTAVTVNYGGSQTFSIAPTTGYHIVDVTMDGASQGAITSYAFTSVNASHTLAATFAKDSFVITATSGGNGTVSCTTPVLYGNASTCTITPANGYVLATLTDNSSDVKALVSGGQYVVSNVTTAHTVAGTFLEANGIACTSNAQCGSGVCTDGVCCNQACNGECQACDVAGSVGTCSPVVGAPHGTRVQCSSDGSACGGTCDGTNTSSCAYPTSATQCRAASCTNGTQTAAASCAGTGSCPTMVTSSCGTYVCGATACKTSCGADTDCSTGNYCSAGVCKPKTTQGGSCTANNQCGTGQCVDGVCCNTACGGQCQACDVAGSVGTCTTVTTGQPHGTRTTCTTDGSSCGGTCDGTSATACDYPTSSTQCRAPSCTNGTQTAAASCAGTGSCPTLVTSSCGTYACGATACKTSCGADTDCSTGNYCSAGVCKPKTTQGAACTANNQCGTGQCVDGVCCNTACGGECQACDVAGNVGTCSPVVGAPHGIRQQCATDGSSCGGSCDGANTTACAYPSGSTQCRAASCTNGTQTAAATCAGNGSCPAMVTSSCGAYVCGATACKSSCSADTDCASGNYCSSGVCKAKEVLATQCTANSQCASGSCVDGVCCNTACGGQCQACDVAGSVGTCTTVASGQPHGARTACTTDGSSCAGTCDGTSATACDYPGNATQCRAPSCSNGVATVAASCAGNGSCPALATVSCGAYVCDTTACKTSCNVDPDCATGNYCAADHTCKPKTPQAGACTTDAQCGTGSCVDGVCCDTACNGQCQACDVPGSVGTCSPTTGAPHGTRAQCATDGSLCGGVCDGTHTASCTFPGDTVSCRGASCTAGSATLAAGCNGAGSCPAPQTVTCGPNGCGPTSCNGPCTADTDCPTGDWCEAGVCKVKGNPGDACSAASQCASNFCADGVCCNSACDGQCEACAEPGKAGTCSPVAGTPRGPRTACNSDGSACGGTCDGTTARSCTYPRGETTCRDASCSAGVAVLGATCNGSGACPAEQDVACAPYVCGTNACKGDCTVDSDCVAGDYCAAGVCKPKEQPGAACSTSSQCGTGQCVDNVCCNVACDGQCQACDVPGSVGTCTNVVGAPHGGRQSCASDGSLCGGVCDGSSPSACAYPAADTTCRGGACSAGVATLSAACDGAGHCPAKQTQACGNFICGPNACVGNCSSDTDCVSGSYCSAGVCTKKIDNGGSCSSNAQCGSGECVDGVCCNVACDGQCQACDVPGKLGTCSPVPTGGAPHGKRQACATDGSLCGGVCDGTNVAACGFPGQNVQCRGASCENGVTTAAASCNGAGACPAADHQSCGPLGCDGNVCAAHCTSDTQCPSDASCVAGVCEPKGKAGVWRVAGSGGCSSAGAETFLPLLGVLVLLLRRRKAVAAVVLVAAGAAQAQMQQQPVDPSFLADRFAPGAGSSDILGVGGARAPDHLDVHMSLFFAYAKDPLKLVAVNDSTQEFHILNSQTLMHVGASVGLWNRFELGMVLPVLVAQGATANDLLGPVIAPTAGVGDIRIVPKAELVRARSFVVALAPAFSLPTGRGHAWLSQGGPTFSPEVRAEYAGLPVRLAGSVGVALRGARELANLTVSNALQWGVGGELPFKVVQQDLTALLTFNGERGLNRGGVVERPMELLGALRWFLPAGLNATFGAGPGLSEGYGSPRYRILAGIGFDPSRLPQQKIIRPAALPLVQEAPRPAPAPAAVTPPPAPPPAIVEAPKPAEKPAPLLALELAPVAPPPPAALPLELAVAPPPAAPQRVVRDGHIALLANVKFATNKDVILPESKPILDGVVKVLQENPEFRKVRVDGHTDAQGGAKHNKDLSQRRAQSVQRYLVNAGVAKARLAAKGFGQDKPIASNLDPVGRAKNRRVEFVVLEGPTPDGAATSEAPAGPRTATK